MIIIEYVDWGTPIADNKAENEALMIWEKFGDIENFQYPTSTENLITAFRLLIAEGVIPCDSIVFKFNEDMIYPNEYGVIRYPKGFCDAEKKMLLRILNATRKKDKN